MKLVTFKRIFEEENVRSDVNPVLEYGLPVTSPDGSILRPAGGREMQEKPEITGVRGPREEPETRGACGLQEEPQTRRLCGLQAMEEVGLLSSDGRMILPLSRTAFSFPDMNTLIAESTPEMMQELGRIAAAFEVFAGRQREQAEKEQAEGKTEQTEKERAEGGRSENGAPGKQAGVPADSPAQPQNPALQVGKEARILSPIPQPLQDVICLGLNYTEHAEEAAAYSSESFVSRDRYPVYFSKRVFYSQGDGETVPAYEGLVDSLDYEVELAVIIGRDVKGIAPEDVPGCIFGYTILNDFSARNLQTRHTQWYLGKSLDGYTPMGPCIVTADEFAWPPKLHISSTVNGELRQDSTTDMLLFGLERIISELSCAMTLRAGTIISTGTPSGVGMGFDPPKFLHAGDTVTCAIEGIGTLTNRIV